MAQWPPTRVLTAVDFGDPSIAALTLAGRFTAAVGGTLTVIYAETVDVPPYFTHDQLETIEREVRAARQGAEDAVREFVHVHTPVQASVVVSLQPETEAILAAAKDADLIVVGTHGRRGPKRWWLGSVAERVVREAHVPVLVVHAAPHALRETAPVLNPVVLGGENASEEAHRWGDLFAAALGGSLVEGPDVDACDSTRVESTSLVVVSLPRIPGQRAVHEHVVALARTCTVPVLFVPTESNGKHVPA